MSESSNAGRWLADQRPIRTVKCQHCGTEFKGRGRAKYCSRYCREMAYRERKSEK